MLQTQTDNYIFGKVISVGSSVRTSLVQRCLGAGRYEQGRALHQHGELRFMPAERYDFDTKQDRAELRHVCHPLESVFR